MLAVAERFAPLGFLFPTWLARERARFALRRRACGFLRLEFLILFETQRQQFASRERRAHGAPGFVRVAAIGETAAQRERFDIGKRILDSLLDSPELQLAHARRIDHQRT